VQKQHDNTESVKREPKVRLTDSDRTTRWVAKTVSDSFVPEGHQEERDVHDNFVTGDQNTQQQHHEEPILLNIRNMRPFHKKTNTNK